MDTKETLINKHKRALESTARINCFIGRTYGDHREILELIQKFNPNYPEPNWSCGHCLLQMYYDCLEYINKTKNK